MIMICIVRGFVKPPRRGREFASRSSPAPRFWANPVPPSRMDVSVRANGRWKPDPDRHAIPAPPNSAPARVPGTPDLDHHPASPARGTAPARGRRMPEPNRDTVRPPRVSVWAVGRRRPGPDRDATRPRGPERVGGRWTPELDGHTTRTPRPAAPNGGPRSPDRDRDANCPGGPGRGGVRWTPEPNRDTPRPRGHGRGDGRWKPGLDLHAARTPLGSAPSIGRRPLESTTGGFERCCGMCPSKTATTSARRRFC